MADSLKQDYAKIQKAGAELVMVSPDSLEQHRQYALMLFGERLPYLFVSDRTLDIAHRYGLLREEEHHHGGFYYRSLWILNSDGFMLQDNRKKRILNRPRPLVLWRVENLLLILQHRSIRPPRHL